MSYIEENGYFIFDGIKSSDYGVWIHGGGTYNAPKRRYKDYTVPGRNGTLTIDEGVFEEIEVVYPAFIARNFPENIEAFRNQLMSRSGYVRMTDSYHPDEYYLAKYMDGLDADVAPGGVGAQFNLTFKRDPRRFLVSGETPITIGVPIDIQTVSGSIVSIDADADTKITGVVANIEPVQAGSGDPSPDNIRPITGHTSVEVTRAGKNLIPYPYYWTTRTHNGITYTDNGDGTITANGTATAESRFYLTTSATAPTDNFFVITDGVQYTLSTGLDSAISGAYLEYAIRDSVPNAWISNRTQTELTFTMNTVPEGAYWKWSNAYIRIVSGTTVNNLVFKPMLRLASDTDATYEKYTAQKYTTALRRTVYGGALDVVSGLLTVADVNIESYSGQSLPGKWISDRDVYTQGGIPTTGAQVVYELATPQTYQLTPQEVTTLLGTNNIWADTGDVTAKYGTVLSSVENPTLFDSKPLIEVMFATDVKNMIQLPYYNTSPYTHNGITFTVNGREITANGTATARAWYSMVWHGSIPEGTYHLSGVPDAPGVEIDCWFQRKSDSVQLANFVATSDGIDFAVTQALADAYWNLQVYVASGTTLVNEIITPVIKASGNQSVLLVGDSRIVLTNNYPSICIDSEIQDCYYGTSNANPSVEFTDDDFPELPPGETGVTFGGGISNVKITPRWYIV